MTPELEARINALAEECAASDDDDDRLAAVVLLTLHAAAGIGLLGSLSDWTVPFRARMKQHCDEALNSRN